MTVTVISRGLRLPFLLPFPAFESSRRTRSFFKGASWNLNTPSSTSSNLLGAIRGRGSESSYQPSPQGLRSCTNLATCTHPPRRHHDEHAHVRAVCKGRDREGSQPERASKGTRIDRRMPLPVGRVSSATCATSGTRRTWHRGAVLGVGCDAARWAVGGGEQQSYGHGGCAVRPRVSVTGDLCLLGRACGRGEHRPVSGGGHVGVWRGRGAGCGGS